MVEAKGESLPFPQGRWIKTLGENGEAELSLDANLLQVMLKPSESAQTLCFKGNYQMDGELKCKGIVDRIKLDTPNVKLEVALETPFDLVMERTADGLRVDHKQSGETQAQSPLGGTYRRVNPNRMVFRESALRTAPVREESPDPIVRAGENFRVPSWNGSFKAADYEPDRQGFTLQAPFP